MTEEKKVPLWKQPTSTCRSCRAPVYWITMAKSGKKISLNPRPVRLITEEGELVHAYHSHFETCPQAKNWRKKGDEQRYHEDKPRGKAE